MQSHKQKKQDPYLLRPNSYYMLLVHLNENISLYEKHIFDKPTAIFLKIINSQNSNLSHSLDLKKLKKISSDEVSILSSQLMYQISFHKSEKKNHLFAEKKIDFS